MITLDKVKMTVIQTADNGVSSCEISVSDTGKIRLIEHFEWKTRPGERGVNVFEEI
jgi:hypothetical protein